MSGWSRPQSFRIANAANVSGTTHQKPTFKFDAQVHGLRALPPETFAHTLSGHRFSSLQTLLVSGRRWSGSLQCGGYGLGGYGLGGCSLAGYGLGGYGLRGSGLGGYSLGGYGLGVYIREAMVWEATVSGH